MISPAFDENKFFNAIMDKTVPEIVAIVNAEIREIEVQTTRVRGSFDARRKVRCQYSGILADFLLFLRYGVRPGSIQDEEFARFRPICARLVRRKHLSPTVLKLFQPKS